jgi:arsenate reductase/ArsR family transcriptional regulator
MESFLAVANALSDKTRLRLLLSLRGHELCVCQLVEFIGLADSTVSRHMSILKSAGLVDAKKTGRWVYYKLAESEAGTTATEMLDIVRLQFSDDPQFLSDARQVAEIRERGEVEICVEESTVSS